MNALSLYITACRSILQSSPDDIDSWTDIHRLLTYLRQTLLCCVCGNLLIVPMTSRSCQQHGICKTCLGRPVACVRCREHEGFIEDTQLKLVLQMYKQLCSYLLSITSNCQVGNLNGGNGINFSDLIREGAAYQDKSNKESESFEGILENDATTNGNRCVTNGNYVTHEVETEEQDTSENVRKSLRTHTKSKSAKSKERQGCRCGMTTPNPGKLTCYGQRCPCYAKNIPCKNCRCRGCHNPYRISKLEGTNRKSDPEVSFDNSYLSVVSKKK